ncbi:MAG: DeoR/GlpR family DNA-binding transcription regulator [Actinomycetota bacterium]|nr:DeoR/GlpR family DNA-binding transcription regulator [Actinomycetota bacterium]
MSAASVEVAVPARLRRERMRSVINDRDFVRVADLSLMFGISEVTVRSDLDELAHRGHVRRIRGGAVPRAESAAERSFEESAGANASEKDAIGKAAAALVAAGDTILLDVGTTTNAVARALVDRADLADVVVLTNGLNIALTLEPAIPRFTVVVTGGTLRPLQHSLVDPLAGAVLDRINAGTLFLGCNGVDPEGGITNINLPEADVKRRMLAAARRRVVTADGSKIGDVALAHLCDVAAVDLLITSASADPAILERLQEQGPEILVT